MMRLRLILVSLAATLTLGSLAATGGYAWYLRSDGYRGECAAALGRSLNLPSDIGRVVPLSRNARAFEDIRVWLPDRRALAHHVRTAVVSAVPTPTDPNAYEIMLSGGQTDISNRTWLMGDYRRVVDASLRGGFLPNGPERVQFDDLSIAFERDRFRLALQHAAGLIDFASPRIGVAEILCRRFNGVPCAEPALLTVEFEPNDGGIRINRLELTLPRLPISATGIRDLLGIEGLSGDFNGHLKYGETGEGRWFEITGTCHALDLAELTAGLLTRPWNGSFPTLELVEFSGRANVPQRLRFRGQIRGLAPSEIAATWGLPEIGGQIDLTVAEADLNGDGLSRLVASGVSSGLELVAISGALGMGKASGHLRVQIDDLTIENNHLKSLDATIAVDEKDETPRWIEGALLKSLVDRAFQIQLPPMLPERIEYSRLGLRLEVRDEILTIFGTHGPRENTILTVRLFGQEVPLIFEPKQSFDLKPWMAELRKSAVENVRARAAQFPVRVQ